jgi:hypothetical protein
MRLLLTLLLVPALAHAETAVGFRVGGYGFREPGTDLGWQDCRMNGVGLFAERSLVPLVSLEVGLDAYFAHGHDPVDEESHHDTHAAMDRVSTLVSAAGLVRPLPGARVSPYVEVGLGLELTRVAVDTDEQSYVLPLAFFGLGGDLRLGRARLGAVFRMHAMGHFDHAAELSVEPELAAQLQFYAALALF